MSTFTITGNITLTQGVMTAAHVPDPAATVSFQTSAVDPVDATVFTFSSQAIGAAAADRKVVVCVTGIQGNSTGEVSSMTIGGEAASLVVAQ